MELLTVKMLNSCIERQLNKEMARFGLTYTQATIIGMLSENSGRKIFQKTLEEMLGLRRPTVSGILLRMEKDGMIKNEPDPGDKRFKVITLTEEAKGIAEHVRERVNAISALFLSGFSDKELKTLENYLNRMIRNGLDHENHTDWRNETI